MGRARELRPRETRIRFGIFGPTQAVVDDVEVAIPAAQQRIILAGLLLYNNRVVSIDRIAWFLWGEKLPPSAVPTIRTYVMRLRRTLGPQVAERIVTKAPGYMITVSPGESDLASFFDLHGRAGELAAEGRHAEASTALSSALALWRDAPLLDVPSPTLQDMEVPPLLELRMQTLEWWIDLELQLGRHARLVPQLSHLVRAHPLRETLTAQLMLALHGAGRQSDALAAFLHTRNLLIEQLGSEPGQELRHVQRLILRTDGGPRHARPQVPAQATDRGSAHSGHLENRWRLIGSPSFGW
ncbi:DNA-binding SARP family transcriptional activator [Umezawaea tangerina]|uniref:DNA-binding SARP family transcriptional activator n=1 Tax=Umezawaea tangerina TaxID=84725 RepID=A0A2T0SGK1_9PSEU|nr:DNA-binding SARP family transcriptional activator [Umezawaea tangerina]